VHDLPKLAGHILEEEFNQQYDNAEEVEDGDMDRAEFSKQILMFNLHRDEEMLDITTNKRKKVYAARDNDIEIEDLTDSSESDREDLTDGLMLQKLKNRTAQESAKI